MKDWRIKIQYPCSFNSPKSRLLANRATPLNSFPIRQSVVEPKDPKEENKGESREGGQRPHNATFCINDGTSEETQAKRFIVNNFE